MLNLWFNEGIALGLAQAVVVVLLALGVVLLANRQSIHLTRETVVALARGIVQIVLVGSVLLLLLDTPRWTSIFVLLAMMETATTIAGRRAANVPGAYRVAFLGIGIGAGGTIALMAALGVIDTAVSALIPVGSMIIAQAMNTCALALERFRADVIANTGAIEAALALGAQPHPAIRRQVQAAVEASLIPRIGALSSLGIVWIPGLMAGMVLSGSDPIYAAIYQFVVIAMIYASSGFTAVISTLLIRRYIFSDAAQLLLRPTAE